MAFVRKFVNHFSVSFILIVVITSSQTHEVSNGINHVENNNSLTNHEVSKVYAQKLINQFSNHHAMRLRDFENMLQVFDEEQNTELNETVRCIDGLRILSFMESESGLEHNLTKSFEIDVDHMISVCPILLFQISNQSLVTESTCLEPKEKAKLMESRALVWFYSTIALIGISLCGLFGVIVIPIVDKNYYFYVLQFFMALAVGTLTGDALLHLLPHAMRPLRDDMTQPELLEMMMHRGIAAVLGIVSFCMVERFLTLITKWKSRDQNKSSSDPNLKIETENLQKSSRQHGHSHGTVDMKSDSVSSIVWMVILGDGLHNFTDGMAIGAAFSNNIAGGFSTAVAVFCHELPHELGDFAVLLKAGMSARKAIYYNILSSILSFIGMCVGISIGDTPETTQWVFAAAAGLFIYIALVDMVNNDDK